MVGTRIERLPEVDAPVAAVEYDRIDEVDAVSILCAPGLLAIDDYPWSEPIESLQSFLTSEQRGIDGSQAASLKGDRLSDLLESYYADVDSIFDRLFGGSYVPVSKSCSWRARTFENAPLHFDTNYVPGHTRITAYINFSRRERHYGVSHSLPWLIQNVPESVALAIGDKPYTPDEAMMLLRDAGVKGYPPLHSLSPRHLLWFPTGTVWFFDPKLLSHEVRFGDGAFCRSWLVRAAQPHHLPDYHLKLLQERYPMKRYENLKKAIAATVNTTSLHKPFRILEVGVWRGDHALEMIRYAQKLGRTAVEYYGFDLFESLYSRLTEEEKRVAVSKRKPPLSVAEVRRKLEKTGAEVRLFEGDTRITLTKPSLPPMNLIFIDGSHEVSAIASDWQNCQRLVTDKTVVIFDDYMVDREDIGCKTLIDGLAEGDPAYQSALLEPVDYFPESGFRIRMAKVTRRS